MLTFRKEQYYTYWMVKGELLKEYNLAVEDNIKLCSHFYYFELLKKKKRIWSGFLTKSYS